MSDQNLTDAVEADAPPAPHGPGLMGLIKAGVFILIIVVVEVVGASLFIPSARETEDLARKIAAAAAGQATQNDPDAVDQDMPTNADLDIREVDLGTYNVTRYNPTTQTTLTIDVQLYGAVLADEESEFTTQFEKAKGRVGEQVVLTLHAAQSTELADAGLGLIKRKILEKTNRALGKPLVREVLFSKFNFVER